MFLPRTHLLISVCSPPMQALDYTLVNILDTPIALVAVLCYLVGVY